MLTGEVKGLHPVATRSESAVRVQGVSRSAIKSRGARGAGRWWGLLYTPSQPLLTGMHFTEKEHSSSLLQKKKKKEKNTHSAERERERERERDRERERERDRQTDRQTDRLTD